MQKKGVTKKTTFYYRASQVNISVVFFGFCCFHEAGLRDAEALGLRSNVVHRNLLLSALERLSHWQQAIDNLRDLRDENLEVALEFPQIKGMRNASQKLMVDQCHKKYGVTMPKRLVRFAEKWTHPQLLRPQRRP